MKKNIIAFTGSKGSGKSTAASILRSLTPLKTKEIAFADHLKNVCSQVFKLDLQFFLKPELKDAELENFIHLDKQSILEIFRLFEVGEYQFDTHVRKHMGQVFDTPRKVLQYVGLEVLQTVNPLIHVEFLLKKIDSGALSVITDLRFSQEFEALSKEPSFLPIYVFNKNAELLAATDLHMSEKDWKIFKERCIILDNNGNIGSLTENIKKIIEEYLT